MSPFDTDEKQFCSREQL